MASPSESHAPAMSSDGDNDMMAVTVHLTIYETDASRSEHALSHLTGSQGSTADLETCILKGGTVGDLKAVLESQDLIPDEMDEFTLEVRLAAHAPCVKDTDVISESTKHIYLTLRPKGSTVPTVSNVEPAVPTDTPSTQSAFGPTTRLPQTVQYPLGLFMTPLRRVQQQQQQQQPAVIPPSATSVNSRLLPFLSPFEAFGAAASCPDELPETLLADPAMLQQIMNSPMMRSLMSNPDILRSILEANPQIRQLREQHPELNHLLNDPELLQQSMRAMQNPGLMQEMINNTDRVLNNIDAIPGGFNALRRVYQSIQEPIWDVALGRGASSQQNEERPRHYDLQTNSAPSTQTIPNPWATARPSSLGTVPERRSAPQVETQSRRHDVALRREPTETTTALRPSTHSQRPRTLLPGQSLRTSAVDATTRSPAVCTTHQSSPTVSSTATALPLTPSVASRNDPRHDVQCNPSQPDIPAHIPPQSPTPNSERNVSENPTSPGHFADGRSSPVETVPALQTEPLDVSVPLTSARSQNSSISLPTETHQSDDLSTGETIAPTYTPDESSSLASQVTSLPLPYLFQNIFPNPRRLRSLGGLSLPPHIQGVMRSTPKEERDEDRESTDGRPSSDSPKSKERR